MKNNQTLYDNWTIDFRKILFCMGILILGTLYNAEEPRALAIAVIVQGASNIDSLWDGLNDKRICIRLKIMSALVIFFSALAGVFAIITLVSSKEYFDMQNNNCAWIFVLLVLIAVASPIILLITDVVVNIKIEVQKQKESLNGGEEDEL